jgi:hypothetical protein
LRCPPDTNQTKYNIPSNNKSRELNSIYLKHSKMQAITQNGISNSPKLESQEHGIIMEEPLFNVKKFIKSQRHSV